MVMVTVLVLALVIATQNSPERHVRAADSKILRLIGVGLSRSQTFRGLIATLDQSDVIVYIEPKLTGRKDLAAYLVHTVVAQGGYRYLHIVIDTRGSERRLVSLLAHELQHSVEVAQAPDARDAESLEKLFSRLAVMFGCTLTACNETQAARDIEHLVNEEFGRR
jgi:hypothetical protein